MLKGRTMSPGQIALAQLRASASIARHATFAQKNVVPVRAHVSVTKPVSKRASKSMGRKTLTLKVRNWQINAAHFN
jgi:hypothetical protein